MANAREIKLRIKGINETKKITKAMKLISAAKLKKARAMHEATFPFFNKIQNTMANILKRSPDIETVYFGEREKNDNSKSGYIVIASDKGLTGGYNHNIVKLAESVINKENSVIFPIGNTVKESLMRDGYNITEEFGIDEYCVAVDTAKDIAEYMIKMFKQEKINELYLIYTEMQSAINLRPKMIKILPLDRELFKEADNEKEETKEVLKFEPSVNFVFDILARKYVKGILYGGMVEAYVSEHSARMNAMDSATSNAEKMIKKLTLNYNRARQAAITQEISEIVSGAANI